jgi:hypothetical protein
MCLWPAIFLTLPLLGVLARQGVGRGNARLDLAFWLAMGGVLALCRVACMSFAYVLICFLSHAATGMRIRLTRWDLAW